MNYIRKSLMLEVMLLTVANTSFCQTATHTPDTTNTTPSRLTSEVQTALDTSLTDLLATGNADTTNVEALIAKGADMKFKDSSYGATPLHFAAFYNQAKVAQLLIADHADVNAKSMGGSTPLMIDGGTPLLFASFKGSKDVANLLIADHADVNAKCNSGGTALFFAADKDMAALLLASNADMEAKDSSGNTPLYSALDDNRSSVALLLINRGANLNVKVRGIGEFYRAAQFYTNDDDVLFKAFIAHGAGVNLNDDDDGETPLFGAAVYGVPSSVKFLIELGANVNAKDNDGETPLEEIAQNAMNLSGDDEAAAEAKITILINNGADVNTKDNVGNTPLHVSVTKKLDDFLIAHGADVNLMNNNGLKPAQMFSKAEE